MTSSSTLPVPTSFDAISLETARLVLRPCTTADTATLFDLYSDAETMRYWGSPPWTDPEEALRKVTRDDEARVAGRALGLGVTARDGGFLIGTCALHAFHPANRRCEVGYLLDRRRWGQGLMQEALVALLDHGFDVLHLHRVEADVDPDNAASARLLERLGFGREGRLRERWLVGDRWSDSTLHGLLAREWRGGSRVAAVEDAGRVRQRRTGA